LVEVVENKGKTFVFILRDKNLEGHDEIKKVRRGVTPYEAITKVRECDSKIVREHIKTALSR